MTDKVWKTLALGSLALTLTMALFIWKLVNPTPKPASQANSLNSTTIIVPTPTPVTRIERADQVYQNKYFILKTVDDKGINQTYKIQNDFSVDDIGNPKVSPEGKYGCVTEQASGYVGFYIFSLPDGKPVEQGKQYSSCVEWIDNHEVILSEHLYNSSITSHFLYNASTKSKKLLGAYSDENYSIP